MQVFVNKRIAILLREKIPKAKPERTNNQRYAKTECSEIGGGKGGAGVKGGDRTGGMMGAMGVAGWAEGAGGGRRNEVAEKKRKMCVGLRNYRTGFRNDSLSL